MARIFKLWVLCGRKRTKATCRACAHDPERTRRLNERRTRKKRPLEPTCREGDNGRRYHHSRKWYLSLKILHSYKTG